MNEHKRRGSRVLLAMLLWGAALAVGSLLAEESGGDTYVVINSGAGVQSLSTEDTANVFLGNKRHWSDGSRVKLAVLRPPELQKDFLEVVTGRSPNQYWSHWRNIVFSGRGFMPKVFDTEEELLTYVAREKGAVGQIVNTSLADDSSVRVICIGQEVGK